MQFRKGHHRFAFVFPRLGIAIKLPFVRLLAVICDITNRIIRDQLWSMLREVTYSVDQVGYKNCLLGGIFANWREFLFYRKTRNSLLQPTYFSFLGLLNIQKSGKPCLLQAVDLWCQLYELTNAKVFDSSHHFANPDNFCFDRGGLKMVDYGSNRTHRVIVEYGAKIVAQFDPSYSWEEKKRARAVQRKQ